MTDDKGLYLPGKDDSTSLAPRVWCFSGVTTYRWPVLPSCSKSRLPREASEMLDPELPLREILAGSCGGGAEGWDGGNITGTMTMPQVTYRYPASLITTLPLHSECPCIVNALV